MTTGVAPDAVELLTTDHRTVEQLFRHLSAALEVGAVENQRDVAQRIVRELSVHAAIEEQVLYPAARELLPQGDRLVDDGLDAHGEMKRVLAELAACGPGDPEFEACARRLMALVRSHVEEEETELLPALREAAGQERLQELGAALDRAKKLASTRPHPHAPDRPPANIVVGAVAALADRARGSGHDFVHEPQS